MQLSLKYLLIFLLAGNITFAQEDETNYTYSAGAEVFSGFIVKHHNVMGHLITDHPTGFRLKFNRESYGYKAWEQRYNYPTFSTSLSYYDLKNDEAIGKVVSLNLGLGFHLNNFTASKNDLQLYFGYGLAYFSRTYEKETNNINTVISTSLNWSVSLRLGYTRQVTDRLMLGAALQFSHFSNAARKVPNYGLNIVNANLGAYYIFNKHKPAYQYDRKMLHDYSTKSYVNIDFRFGLTEYKPVGSGTFPYYALSVFWNKQVNRKSILDAGIEGYMNKGLEAEIENKSKPNEDTPDYKAVGIMIGHELVINKLVFVTQLGFYIYKPHISNERFYSKVGLKYYFSENIFGSFILKTHDAVAEVMEYGIGYRF